MGAPLPAWLFFLHFPNLESWISVESCQSEQNRTALCSFEPNLSGRTAKELRQLKIPRLPFHKIRSIHMPLYRRAEISPRRARGCAASWTADLAVVEARQPSSVVFQRPEAKLGQRASAGSGRGTVLTHTRRADGSASTPACSLRDVAAPLGACSHQRSSAAPGRPCS